MGFSGAPQGYWLLLWISLPAHGCSEYRGNYSAIGCDTLFNNVRRVPLDAILRELVDDLLCDLLASVFSVYLIGLLHDVVPEGILDNYVEVAADAVYYSRRHLGVLNLFHEHFQHADAMLILTQLDELFEKLVEEVSQMDRVES